MPQDKKKSPSMWKYTQAISPANKAGRAALVKVGRTIFAMNPVGRALHVPLNAMYVYKVFKDKSIKGKQTRLREKEILRERRKREQRRRAAFYDTSWSKPKTKVQNQKKLERHRNATNSFLKRGG